MILFKETYWIRLFYLFLLRMRSIDRDVVLSASVLLGPWRETTRGLPNFFASSV
jgi:hypothetical protein